MEDIYLYGDGLSFVLLILNLIISLVTIFYYMRLAALLFAGNEQNLVSVVSSGIS